MFQTTQQITFSQTPIHNLANIKQNHYNIMKTSITVINISEIMEISFKGPTYVYRVTSECPD